MKKCAENEQIRVLLERVLEYGERITKERPFTEYEKQGRLLSMFGVVCTTALEMYRMEMESKKTLLSPISCDYVRMIARLEELKGSLRKILGEVPLFAKRDYMKYPELTINDIEDFKERFLAFERLPQCDKSGARKTIINIVEFAYNMYDTLFMGLTTIAQSLQKMRDDEQMLGDHHELLSKRWNLMMKRYLENEWLTDKQVFQNKLDEYINQFGHDKTTLEMFLKQLDRDATDLLSIEMLVTLNRLYLNGEDHLSYIFDHRHELKQEHITRHLCFICCRKLVEQEIELFDLRQPAAGADADLFTCRAAKELVELLNPVIGIQVDFKYDYQYAAYAEALKESGLTYKKKRNGSQIIHYVNATFSEQIDKSILSRFTKKSEEFKKIEDQYRLILSIFNQALGCESIGEINYFQNQGKEFFERLETLKKVL